LKSLAEIGIISANSSEVKELIKEILSKYDGNMNAKYLSQLEKYVYHLLTQFASYSSTTESIFFLYLLYFTLIHILYIAIGNLYKNIDVAKNVIEKLFLGNKSCKPLSYDDVYEILDLIEFKHGKIMLVHKELGFEESKESGLMQEIEETVVFKKASIEEKETSQVNVNKMRTALVSLVLGDLSNLSLITSKSTLNP
jgi:hypothetical protein